MATNLSPSVEIFERDLTLRIPSVTSSVGGIVVAAEKGRLNTLELVINEADYVDRFGIPDDTNYPHWFTATRFLQESNQLYVVRTEDDEKFVAGITIGLSGDVPGVWPTQKQAKEFPLDYDAIGPNEAQSGSVNVFDEESFHIHAVGAGPYYDDIQTVIINQEDYDILVDLKNELAEAKTTEEVQEIAERYYTGTPATTGTSGTPGEDYLSNSLVKDDVIDPTDWSVNTSLLSEYTQLEFGPTDPDEFVFYVYDTQDNLAELYLCSNIKDKRDAQGNIMFGPTLVNDRQQSEFVYLFIADSENAAAGAKLISTGKVRLDAGMEIGGADPLTEDIFDLVGEIETQWSEHFLSIQDLEVDILLDPDYPDILKRHINQIATNVRKDCVALLNVPRDLMVNTSTGRPLKNAYTLMRDYAQNTLNINSSYSAIYGQYFQAFDRYAEKFRWVPVTGYVGAVMARVDFNDASWFAPAGLNRAIISDGVNKIAINPSKAQYDVIYPVGINAIVQRPGQGIVIWGQKTLQSKPSAFDRLNVRRLFLHMERSISKMSEYMLFEFNDDFTRSRFRSLVNPFLSDIESRRGITDYFVVCDETNNTPEVIDRNEFAAEILVKPNRVAEFIKLTFTAVSTGVEFSEVVVRG